MKRRIFIISFAVSLIVLAGSCGSHQTSEHGRNDSVLTNPRGKSDDRSSGADLQKSVVIIIENYSFLPNEITVAPGTKVTWVNKDNVPHTATADDKTFDSRILTQGNEFSHTFSTPGTYAYHCVPHPAMKAKVTVK